MDTDQGTSKWPIGIRLFNRPEYTEQFLKSLINQSRKIDHTRTICFIDVYSKSSDYFLRIPDRTEEVVKLVEHYLPGARIIRPKTNAGLAKALFSLQEAVYSMPNSAWGIFLEDDLVLDNNYLEVLDHFIELANPIEQIVKVSACQIHTGYLKQPAKMDRTGFFLGEGTKAIAERATFFELRREVIVDYLKALEGTSYRHRNRARVFAALAQHGVFNVMGNNDGVLDQCVALFNKLHVTFERDLLKDIGLIGESNFVIPQVAIPAGENGTNPLLLTRQNLIQAQSSLSEELDNIQADYFESMWQVYRRADSIKHTVKFLFTKSLRKIRGRHVKQ